MQSTRKILSVGPSKMALLVAVGLGVSGCGKPSRTELLILGGTPTSDFPEVQFLNITGNSQVFSCSGTFVSPTTLITAAHCVKDRQGMQLASTGEWAVARKFHPNYNPKNVEYDLAVAKFSPTQRSYARFAQPAAEGTDVQMVGYGANSHFWGNSAGIGEKRVGRSKIVMKEEGYLCTAKYHRGESDTSSGLPGDSGGALMQGGRLAGVLAAAQGSFDDDTHEIIELFTVVADLNSEVAKAFFEEASREGFDLGDVSALAGYSPTSRPAGTFCGDPYPLHE